MQKEAAVIQKSNDKASKKKVEEAAKRSKNEENVLNIFLILSNSFYQVRFSFRKRPPQL